MSQATANAPAVISNAANNRQQVPLRDYLNARVAPFIKKAITESLGAEAEFPLQWLGECLIHQSILYEGNPDRTNICERFLYKFEDPKPQEAPPSDAAVAPSVQTAPPTVAEDVAIQPQPEVSMDDATNVATHQVPPSQIHEATAPAAVDVSEQPVTNGIKTEGEDAAHERRDGDTEMGGTI